MLSEPTPKYYWDACAWIGLINTELDKHANLKGIWEFALRGKCELWTSSYVYLEVHKAKAQGGDPFPPEESDRRIDNLLENPVVTRVQVDIEVARLARELRRKFPQELIKKADAIHLATAVYWNVDALHTYDGSHLIPLNGKVNRRDGQKLEICVPNPFAGTLFDSEHEQPKNDPEE